MLIMTIKELKKFYIDYVPRSNNDNKSVKEILSLLDLVSDRKSIEIQATTNGLNRGAIVECLTKLIINNRLNNIVVSAKGVLDLEYKGVKYDIKYCSNYSLGNTPDQNVDYVLQFANGKYHLIEPNEVKINKYGNTCVKQPNELFEIEPSELKEILSMMVGR